MRVFRIAVLALFSCLLSGCGGGGGGGSGGQQPNGSNDFRVTLDRSAINFQATAGGAPPSQIIVATWTGTPPDPVYITAVVEGAGIAPTIPIQITSSSATAAVSVASGLSPGTYNGRVNFLVCRDTACNQRVGGSPLPVSFTVNVSAGTGVRGLSSNIASSFVLGSSVSAVTTNVTVTGDPATTWRVESGAPWVSTSITSGRGSALVGVRIDASSLDVGSYSSAVTIINNNDPTNTVRFPVNATVVAPTISISTESVVIGGTDGLGTGGANIAVSINTGTNSHPWAASATTANGQPWLTTSAGGQVNSTATNIVLDADRSLVAAGRHQGTVSVQVNVRGQTFSRAVQVVLNKEGHWLQASAHGTAFSSFPARAVLSRSVQITSTRGSTHVPWSATSDANWLTVTPSGTTGGSLVLTADPAGLPADTTHIANVTIASSNPAIQNQESIRVALWVSASDPQNVRLAGQHINVLANPVEPWVYTNSGADNNNTIRVYNVYSGALVDTWTPALTTATDMEISQDGRLLFVNDAGAHRIVALDARTGSPVQSYPYSQNASSTGIAYVHAGSRPTLITGIGNIYDVASGTLHTGTIDAGWYRGMLSFAVDPLNRSLFTQNMGLSGSTASQFFITRTALNDDEVVVTFSRTNSGGSNGQDICVSSDGERVYTANGWPYVFYVFASSGFQYAAQLPGDAYPTNTTCGWNGVFVGGAEAYYATEDVWVYRADGSALTAFKMGDTTYTSIAARSLALSGDNTRVIGAVSGNSGQWLVFKGIPAP